MDREIERRNLRTRIVTDPFQPRVRKTAINDAFRNGASMREVREFAGHADIRTTEVCVIRNVRMRRQEPKA